jgi:hypothetical protein
LQGSIALVPKGRWDFDWSAHQSSAQNCVFQQKKGMQEFDPTFCHGFFLALYIVCMDFLYVSAISV